MSDRLRSTVNGNELSVIEDALALAVLGRLLDAGDRGVLDIRIPAGCRPTEECFCGDVQGPTGASLPSTGRKSKPVLTSQPKLAEVKSGMALSCASAGITITSEAISATRQSKDTLDIASSSMVRLVQLAGCRFGPQRGHLRPQGRMPFRSPAYWPPARLW